ncbi:Uncharacterised protein [Mycobacteroides abscessus subsp. abscessus]|nr:Uncharacterised protein [Mycobacteroides abscessus subsp. abscessus]SIJ60426.1 Uncharacterised protein [Mycobacteroides abscessus subsp. bolletii]
MIIAAMVSSTHCAGPISIPAPRAAKALAAASHWLSSPFTAARHTPTAASYRLPLGF